MAIKKNRDTKFIIYQVLYIFVITVLALKGADLDLSQVVAKKEAVNVSVKDSLVALIDSLYASGMNFNIKVDEKQTASIENKELQQKLLAMNQKVQNLTEQIRDIPVEERQPRLEIPKLEEKDNRNLSSPIAIAQTFIQNTWNVTKNTGTVPAQIMDPNGNLITTIAPGEEKKFDLGGQDEILVKFGSKVDHIKVAKNRPPQVKIERATTKMGSSRIYVQELQRVTGFTVTIIDERPDQLKVSWAGPISVSGPIKDQKGNAVYNVSLNIASTEARFDEWADRNASMQDRDGRYKANFFFTVVDQRTKDRVQVGDNFIFTDYSK